MAYGCACGSLLRSLLWLEVPAVQARASCSGWRWLGVSLWRRATACLLQWCWRDPPARGLRCDTAECVAAAPEENRPTERWALKDHVCAAEGLKGPTQKRRPGGICPQGVRVRASNHTQGYPACVVLARLTCQPTHRRTPPPPPPGRPGSQRDERVLSRILTATHFDTSAPARLFRGSTRTAPSRHRTCTCTPRRACRSCT